MPIKQKALQYPLNALEPFISEKTVDVHYNGHHKSYVEKLNKLISGTPYVKMSLEEIILESWAYSEFSSEKNIFNNASQAWNHAFYWNCLINNSKRTPGRILSDALNESFGGPDNFIKLFSSAAARLFGSGWVWLILNRAKKLEIVNTSNAENPMTTGATPLLVCDVWEHAYYIDHLQDRKAYIQNFWSVVNWKFVESCLVSITEHGSHLKSS
jgi:Fe-Mn family superoxide dismutase